MTSRMFSIPVANITKRSNPSPKPACWIVPYRLPNSFKHDENSVKPSTEHDDINGREYREEEIGVYSTGEKRFEQNGAGSQNGGHLGRRDVCIPAITPAGQETVRP